MNNAQRLCFRLWEQLVNTGQGRKLVAFIERAIARFDAYA